MARKDKRRVESDEARAGRMEALDELMDEAVNDGDDDEEYCGDDCGSHDCGGDDCGGHDCGGEGEGGGSFFNPMQGRKVWLILGFILVVIAVAVLYVYQAGDRKTVLGNQPIPAGQLNGQGVPIAGVLPNTGAQNAPMGGRLQPPLSGAGGLSSNIVTCPNCGTQGLPVCSNCGVAMQPLGDGTGLYSCPSCGAVGVPVCPHCGGRMTASGQSPVRQAAQQMAGIGGQFQCPACGATGLPNWDAAGVPHCPVCNTQMQVRSAAGQGLAVVP